MKGRLLLVDDHEVVRDGLRFLLERDGWEVAGEAGSPAEAQAACASAPFDLVLLDLNLDGHDGLHLLATLREEHPNLPILVLSMIGDPAAARTAIRLGAGGYVVKTAPRQDLLAAVATVRSGGVHLDPRVAAGVLEDLRQAPPQPSLQEGDLQLLRSLQQGLNNQEIGALLHLSLGGVKARMRGLFARFGVNDRVSLVVEAMRRGVLPED